MPVGRNHTKAQKSRRNNAQHCAYCLHKFYADGKFRRTIDHFYPLHLAPDCNRSWNKFTICRRCNQMKGCMEPLKFAASIRKTASKLKYCEYKQDLLYIAENVVAIEADLKFYYLMRDVI